MTEPRPQLRLIVDAQTGELVEHDERDILIDQLQAEKKGQSLQIGKLKRELKELRAVEPEHETIREVLQYAHGVWERPRAVIAPGHKRWEKVRARLADRIDERPPWTVAELKLAADGALLDRWFTARRQRLDAQIVYGSPEMVERLSNLAIGFEAKAGVGIGELIEVAPELRVVSWKHVIAICTCGHRRVEHLPGFESCAIPGCDCMGYSLDVFDDFNQRIDPDLKRLMTEDDA